MSNQTFKRMGDYLLNAVPDVPDIRDRYYDPSLMAPAATLELYQTHFSPLLKGSGFGIDNFGVYNLSEALDLDDQVGGIYRKSLLYLVSQAFEEEKRPKPILGMMQ